MTLLAPVLVLAFVLAMVGIHLVSTRVWTGALWGVHAWAFFPAWASLVALALTVIAAWPLTRWIAAAVRGTALAYGPFESNGEGPLTSRARRILIATGAALAGAGLLWVLRARHNLLGDGVAIVAHGSWAGNLHELEPLTVLIQAKVFDLLSALWGAGHSARDVIWNAVALVSVTAGALFIPLAWGLAKEIESAPDRDAGGASRWARALVFVILITQGYLQLFCGYVENYAPLALANALVLFTGLRFARGRGSLLASGAALLFAVALHLSASALIPAWVLLALWGVSRGPNRRRAAIDLGLIVALGIVLTVVLSMLRPGYFLPRTLWDVTVRAVGQRQEDPTYLLSLRHLSDFLNEQMLIGPLGLFAFVGGLAVAAAHRSWRRPDVAFAAMAGIGYAGACVVAGDSNMGYARNWDLLAPAGVVFTTAGLLLMRPAFRPAPSWRGALLVAAALSIFHTLPWVALNMSERRSVERFATLPLGGGRTENTVAFWYAERGDFAEAKRWLKRSLAANPENSRALDLYGRIAFEEHNPRLALDAYLIAVTIRPDKAEYRQQLAFAVAASGGPAVGLGRIDTMMTGHQDNGGLWLERAMLLRASGHRAEADHAKRRAIQLSPGLATTADSLPLLTSR